MRVEVTIKSNRVVDAIMGEIGPESRRQLNSVAGRAVMNAVQRHIRSYMREKHRSARMLGATPTGHYEKGAAAISMSADATGATVTIPIPGIARAWGDVSIRPGPGKSALTLPQGGSRLGRAGGAVARAGVCMSEYWAIEASAGQLERYTALGAGALVHFYALDLYDRFFGYSAFDPFVTAGANGWIDRRRGQVGPAAGLGAFWHLDDNWSIRADASATMGLDSGVEMLYTVSVGLQCSL